MQSLDVKLSQLSGIVDDWPRYALQSCSKLLILSREFSWIIYHMTYTYNMKFITGNTAIM